MMGYDAVMATPRSFLVTNRILLAGIGTLRHAYWSVHTHVHVCMHTHLHACVHTLRRAQTHPQIPNPFDLHHHLFASRPHPRYCGRQLRGQQRSTRSASWRAGSSVCHRHDVPWPQDPVFSYQSGQGSGSSAGCESGSAACCKLSGTHTSCAAK